VIIPAKQYVKSLALSRCYISSSLSSDLYSPHVTTAAVVLWFRVVVEARNVNSDATDDIKVTKTYDNEDTIHRVPG